LAEGLRFALAAERDQLWKRIGEASFLSDDEKREAVGYDAAVLASGTRLPVEALFSKFNPDQPRVPAGNPDGGQWTGGSGAASSGEEGGDSSTGDNADIIPVAQEDRESRYRVDLLEEEQRGGHAIKEHVGKTERYLKTRVESEALAIVARGDSFEGLGVGSFHSLSSATRLVNSTLAQNQAIVDSVTRGEVPIGVMTSHYNSPTGQEAFLPRFHAQPYMRSTYGVSVVIVRDPRSPRGFRVQSAFPRR
jgi:hypothetical protein